jgi:hypothetical protein
MIRSLTALAFACFAGGAHAATFNVSQQIIAVDKGEHSQELTVTFSPAPNTVGGQIDLTMNLDRFGWVQALPSTPQPGMTKECIIVNGAVRVLVASDAPFDTFYTIPVCRFRLRPHLVTPYGNYYTSYANGMTVRLDGSTTPATATSVRVIVDD